MVKRKTTRISFSQRIFRFLLNTSFKFINIFLPENVRLLPYEKQKIGNKKNKKVKLLPRKTDTNLKSNVLKFIFGALLSVFWAIYFFSDLVDLFNQSTNSLKKFAMFIGLTCLFLVVLFIYGYLLSTISQKVAKSNINLTTVGYVVLAIGFLVLAILLTLSTSMFYLWLSLAILIPLYYIVSGALLILKGGRIEQQINNSE